MRTGFRTFAALLLCLLCLAGSFAVAERSVTPYFQTDYTEKLYEDRTVAESGCWAACVSMILSYYGDPAQPVPDPEEVFRWAVDEKLYRGNGLTIGRLQTVLEHYGIETEQRLMTGKQIKDSLNNNGPMIMYVGKGYFTNGGHYILLEKIDDKLKVSVIDPNNREKTRKYYLGGLMEEAGMHEPYLVVTNKIDYETETEKVEEDDGN